MITTKFTGNLGNHMFQYAMVRSIAERREYEFGFNPNPSHDYYGGIPQMDFMEIDYGKIHHAGFDERPPGIEYVYHEEYIHKTYPNGDSVDYHPYQVDFFYLPDNTELIIRCCQDARYFDFEDKNIVKSWFKIKDIYQSHGKRTLNNVDINLDDDNLCVINVRGGEYRTIPNVILREQYWKDAMSHMREINSKMKFICITDDVSYASKLLGYSIPCFHFNIGIDYWTINNAKNLIISNSSFAIFPTWLNENNPYVIAPRYWARHNVSTGYWASSDVWSFGWNFLDRDGEIYDK